MKPVNLDQTAVQQILARAMELDEAAADKLKVEQLRSIAVDLGISAPALEQALAEHMKQLQPVVAQPKLRRWRWVPVGIAAAFLVLIGAALVVRMATPVESQAAQDMVIERTEAVR